MSTTTNKYLTTKSSNLNLSYFFAPTTNFDSTLTKKTTITWKPSSSSKEGFFSFNNKNDLETTKNLIETTPITKSLKTKKTTKMQQKNNKNYETKTILLFDQKKFIAQSSIKNLKEKTKKIATKTTNLSLKTTPKTITKILPTSKIPTTTDLTTTTILKATIKTNNLKNNKIYSNPFENNQKNFNLKESKEDFRPIEIVIEPNFESDYINIESNAVVLPKLNQNLIKTTTISNQLKNQQQNLVSEPVWRRLPPNDLIKIPISPSPSSSVIPTKINSSFLLTNGIKIFASVKTILKGMKFFILKFFIIKNYKF